MRLVIATPLYPPEPGGPATYAALLERELPKVGIETVVVPFAPYRRYIKVFRHFLYHIKVRKNLKSADAVLALDPVSVGLPALWAAQAERKPFFVKVVGDYAWEQGKQRFGVTESLDEFLTRRQNCAQVRTLQHIQTEVAMGATKVIVPSEYLKKVVASWGVPEEKIAVIYNAVSVDTIGDVPAGISSLPRPRVVTVARLVPWKGIEGLIDAVAKARERIPNLALSIVGDGPERSSLEAHVKRVLATGYVFTGAVSHEETLAAMKDADVFALNTAYEGFSHVLLEACLLGVPIVTTASGGNTELLTHEKNALLVEGGTIEEGIVRMLTEPGLKERLAATAKADTETRFGTKKLVGTLSRLLTQI